MRMLQSMPSWRWMTVPLLLLPAWKLSGEEARWTQQAIRDQPGYVSGEFLFESAPFPSCHASTIVETSGGRLLAAWFGGTHERHPDVAIWLARRDADGWSLPREVARGEQFSGKPVPTWNPVLFQPRGGPLLLFYKVGPSPSTWWGRVQSSLDDGHTWSPSRRLPAGILGPIKNKPVQLPDGQIVAPSSTEDDGWRVHFERSEDGGQTWEATAPLAANAGVAAIQPCLLTLSPLRLIAMGRTRSGCIFQAMSEDGGRSWSPLSLTSLPNPNSGIDAVTLTDGRHLLVYNHNSQLKGRSPLNIAVSRDAQHWNGALVLEDEPGSEFSYPAVIQTHDGMVHITYTWKRTRIKHVIVDPSRLQIAEPVN